MTSRFVKDPSAVARYIARATSSLPEKPGHRDGNPRRSRGSSFTMATAAALLVGVLLFTPIVASPQVQIIQTLSNMSVGGFLLAIQRYFGPMMMSYNSAPIRSASLSQTSNLESSMYGGSASSIQPQYVSVYGSQPKANTVPAAFANQSDMADTAANEALALASNSDQFEQTVNTTAAALQQMASTPSSSVANVIQAESAVMQLHSYAVQHRLLASLLRQRATRLAAEMSKAKQSVAGHGTSTQTLQQLLNGGH